MQDNNQVRKSEDRPNSATGKKPMDKSNGHEIILKTYILNRTPISLKFNDGTDQPGRVTQFDKFTVTIMKHSHQGLEVGLETYFKHSIKSFSPVTK